MLEEHKNYHWRGTYDLSFEHHIDKLSLEHAASQDCCICRTIASKVKALQQADIEPATPAVANWEKECFTRASLSYVRQWKVYRLDFRLNRSYNSERVGTFFLKQIGKI